MPSQRGEGNRCFLKTDSQLLNHRLRDVREQMVATPHWRLGETRVAISVGFFLVRMALAWPNGPPTPAHGF
jgi:hypothetical protein